MCAYEEKIATSDVIPGFVAVCMIVLCVATVAYLLTDHGQTWGIESRAKNAAGPAAEEYRRAGHAAQEYARAGDWRMAAFAHERAAEAAGSAAIEWTAAFKAVGETGDWHGRYAHMQSAAAEASKWTSAQAEAYERAADAAAAAGRGTEAASLASRAAEAREVEAGSQFDLAAEDERRSLSRMMDVLGVDYLPPRASRGAQP